MQIFKRFFDITIAGIALVILTPVLMLLAFLLWFQLGSPVLFCQWRPGLKGKPFRLFKFRTMLNTLDQTDHLSTDADRLTPFGNYLRSSSLDELPSLWNVLTGEMSLVGPRPLLMEYLDFYTPEQARRHDVRPGITGWAQINGRNAISWEDKFRLDAWYIDNMSMLFDIKILFMTVVKVLKRKDITQHGHVTMEKFQGSTSD